MKKFLFSMLIMIFYFRPAFFSDCQAKRNYIFADIDISSDFGKRLKFRRLCHICQRIKSDLQLLKKYGYTAITIKDLVMCAKS